MVSPEAVIDLHTHTAYSDGSLTPKELIRLAAANGVECLAITDHDTIAAHLDSEPNQTAEELGIELVTGIEVSSSMYGQDVHVLGLFIDPTASSMAELIATQHDVRQRYRDSVVTAMTRDGWNLSQLEQLPCSATITKAHIADAILLDNGNAKKIQESFREMPTRGELIEALLNVGMRYFVKRDLTRTDQAVDTIKNAGGVAIFAHPVAGIFEGMSTRNMLKIIAESGFDGLEAGYIYFSKSDGDKMVDQIKQYRELAHSLGLLVSAGSDYHGPNVSIGNSVVVGGLGAAGLSRTELELLRDLALSRR